MTWAAAVFLVVAFLFLARALRAPLRVREVVRRVRAAAAILRDTTRSDVEKERALRAHAGRLFVLFLLLVALVAVAAAVPLGAVALLDLAGVVALDAVLDLTLRPVFLLVATALAILGLAVARAPARAPKRSPG